MNATKTAPLFGEWLAPANGDAHYFLGTRSLCGRRSKAGEPPRWGQSGSLTGTFCAACKAANTARWMGCAALQREEKG